MLIECPHMLVTTLVFRNIKLERLYARSLYSTSDRNVPLRENSIRKKALFLFILNTKVTFTNYLCNFESVESAGTLSQILEIISILHFIKVENA